MEKIYETEYGCIDWDVYSDPEFDDEGNEYDGEEYVKIDNLYVKPEYRNCGYARELMEYAVAQIEKDFPGLEIKIVACPKEDSVDLTQLCEFYDSFDLTVIPWQ